MIIKKYQIYIIGLLLLLTGFLGFYSSEWFDVYINDFINLVLIVISFAFFILHKDSFKKFTKKRIYRWIFWGILLYILEVIYTSLIMGIPTNAVLRCSFGFLSLLFYAVLDKYLNKEDKVLYLKKTIVMFALLIALVSILQEFVYLFWGETFLGVSDVSNLFIRNGRIRIRINEGVSILGVFITVFNLRDKINIRKIVCLIILIINLLFVVQTRSAFIYMVISLILGYRLVYRNISKRIIFLMFILLVVFSVLVVNYTEISGAISKLLFEDSSTGIRYEAIRFYWKNFLDYPIMGRGFIPSSEKYGYQTLLGTYYRYYRSDVGIIGFLDERGLIGMIWYFWGLWIMNRNIENHKFSKEYPEAKTLMFYLLICTFTNLFPLLDSGYSFVIFAIIIMKINLIGENDSSKLNRRMIE